MSEIRQIADLLGVEANYEDIVGAIKKLQNKTKNALSEWACVPHVLQSFTQDLDEKAHLPFDEKQLLKSPR